MDARRFVNQYRKFNQIVKEEIGDLEEEIVISLFSLFARHLSVKQKRDNNPFKNYMDYYKKNTSNIDDWSQNLLNYFIVFSPFTRKMILTPTRMKTMMPLGDKMDEKIIALDIETLNLDMEKEGLSFDNPAGWTTSCVCIYDAYFQEEFYYVQDDFIRSLLNSNRSLNKLERTVREMKYLSQDLEGWFNDGYSLLTHNGTNFDIPILKKSIEDGGGSCESVFESDFKHIDMSHSLTTDTFRYKLQHLVKGMLGEERSKLMEAQFAPVEWDKGNYACDSILHPRLHPQL